MITISFIRHGVTAWNLEGRIQGRSDIPLCPDGRQALAARVPGWRLRDRKWVSSPLVRARETASILSGRPVVDIAVDDRLAEMSWGRWEGATLEDLRQRHGSAMAENEARGRHFRPPGGESPFEVQGRVRAWMTEAARDGEDVVAVTHKGVIRAITALALGWDMIGKAPVKLDWAAIHRLTAGTDGQVRVAELNGTGND